MISPVETWVAERTGLGERLGAESLLGWQTARLREVLGYAVAKSRFYGERLRGIDPESVRFASDLGRLPFTSPADVAREPLAFSCVSQAEVARVTTLTTSGTLGVKKRIFFTARDLERTVDYFAAGMRDLVARGRHVLILMPGASENSIGRLLQQALERIDVSSVVGDQGWGAPEAVAAARTADCIVGIPQEILYLCRTEPRLRPKTVLLSADFVPECVIRELARVWDCMVFSHYGMTETGFGCAVQCASREGHHIRDADVFLEIVDPASGRRLDPGERGEIVVTTLRNEAMPLIRYRTGDLGRMLSAPCSCGGVLPRLGRVDGRRDNELTLPGGQLLSIHRLDEGLFALPGVRSFLAELLDRPAGPLLRLTIDAADMLDEEALRSLLPRDIAVEVSYAQLNPFSSRAKRRIRYS